MSVVTAGVLRSAAGRWRRIDPLLPDPKLSADEGCDAELTVPGSNGLAAAVGWCGHREVEPEAAELAWGAAAAQFWLTACRARRGRVAVTLLHHGQLNPLSAPFWSRMGYRPLWTNWEIRPARALR